MHSSPAALSLPLCHNSLPTKPAPACVPTPPAPRAVCRSMVFGDRVWSLAKTQREITPRGKRAKGPAGKAACANRSKRKRRPALLAMPESELQAKLRFFQAIDAEVLEIERDRDDKPALPAKKAGAEAGGPPCC